MHAEAYSWLKARAAGEGGVLPTHRVPSGMKMLGN